MSKIANLPALGDLADKVREIALKRPNYVYQRKNPFRPDDGGPTCVYVEQIPGGTYIPSCLIGHAFVELGVAPEDLVFAEAEGINIFLVLEKWGYDLEDPRVTWLENVQYAQDSGVAWGDAVDQACDRDTAA